MSQADSALVLVDKLDTNLKVCGYSSIKKASLRSTVDSKLASFGILILPCENLTLFIPKDPSPNCSGYLKSF